MTSDSGELKPASIESIEGEIAALAEEHERGRAFERAVLHYVVHDPEVEIREAWLWEDRPAGEVLPPATSAWCPRTGQRGTESLGPREGGAEMRKIIGLALGLALSLTAIAAAPASGGATIERGTYAGTYFDGCFGEVIAYEVPWQVVLHKRLDNGGGWHYTYQYTYRGSGVGQTSGDKYQFKHNETEQDNANAVGQFELLWNGRTRMVRQGGGSSFSFITGRFVVSANGEVRLDDFEITSTCEP